MSEQEILGRLTLILRDLLSDESIVLAMETHREDVPNWDSFNYLNFIVATEIDFALKFKTGEVDAFENVGAIVARIKEMAG